MSIRAKILSIAIIALVLGNSAEVVTSGYIFTRGYSKALARALALGESLRAQLDRIFGLGIPLHELVGFEKRCQELVERNSGIAYAVVVDLDGKILFHSDPSLFGKELPRLPSESNVHRSRWSSFTFGYTGDYEVVVPVLNNLGEKIAAIHVGISAARCAL